MAHRSDTDSPDHKKIKIHEHQPDVLDKAKSVLVKDLPEICGELQFKSFMEKMRISNNIYPEFKKSVVRVMHFRKDNYAFVEFSSMDIARRIIELKGATFFKTAVTFESPLYDDETVHQDDLTLGDMSRFPLGVQASTPVKSVEDMLRGLSPFKASSSRRALLPSDVNNNGHQRGTENDKDIIPLSEEGDGMDAPLEVSDRAQGENANGEQNAAVALPKILFGNILYEPFDEDNFTKFIKWCIKLKCVVGQGVDTSFTVGTYDNVKKTVIVEFQSVEVADELCNNVQFAHYMTVPWTLERVGEIEVQVPMIEFGDIIYEPFDKDDFNKFLKWCIKRKCQFSDGIGIDSSFSIVRYNPLKKSVIVEFKSSEVVKEVCSKLRDTQYMLSPWTLTEVKTNQASMPVSTDSEITAVNKEPTSIDISDIVTVDTISGAEEASEGRPVPLKPSAFLMRSEEGKKLFLQKLLLTRRLFQNKRNHPSGYSRLVGEICKAGVQLDMQEAKVRRKYWLDLNNDLKKGTQTSPYAQVLGVIFNGEPAEILKGTAFEVDDGSEMTLHDPQRLAATAEMFSSGETWSTAAAHRLLRIVRANLEELRGAANTDNFWREVSRMFPSEPHNATSCEKKFTKAKQLYRDHGAKLNRSGVEGPGAQRRENAVGHGEERSEIAEDQSIQLRGTSDPWFWNDDMHIIMSKDDIANPPMTLATGSSNAVTLANASISRSNERIPNSRSRIPQLHKPKSQKAMFADLASSLIAAMDRRTNLLAGKLKEPQANQHDPVEDDEEEEDLRFGKN